MSTWLNAWRHQKTRRPEAPVMELLVVAGADAGAQFTLEGDEVLVGRGQPESGQTDVVRLRDKSISRRQAWIRRDASGTWLEHVAAASNPTRINGREVERARLEVGDRIEMGRVEIDVRSRGGFNLRGLTEIMEGVARESTQSQPPGEPTLGIEPGGERTTRGGAATEQGLSDQVTDIRPMSVEIGELRLVQGPDALPHDVAPTYPLGPGATRIGRGRDVEVQIAELGVSRLHAEIVVEDGRLMLVQRSRTNPTLINGVPVADRSALEDGDEIQLADRVVLSLRLAPRRPGARRAKRPGSGLSRQMAEKIDLDRSIEEFSVMGSFLDVDIVSSRAMKGQGAKAEHIIVSFDRFRSYVGGICEEWEGQVLNSNGDELMCFFESAARAVLAGSAMLERLSDFNRQLNLLETDFRFRIGVHTGLSLVDLDAGIAYSDVLDTAGHIQKLAEPDTLLLSQTTLDSLPGPVPVSKAGELTGDGRLLYRLERFVRAEDLDLARGE